MSKSGDAGLALLVLGHEVRIHCPDARGGDALRANFSALPAPAAGADFPRIDIAVEPAGEDVFEVRLGAAEAMRSEGLDGLVYDVEKLLTIELQRRRADLLFLHAAVLAKGERAVLLLAESGGGKSTLCWRLLHEGFSYLSDELAPVDVARAIVHPYPHALCLKADPPSGPALPPDALRLGRTTHVPVELLPAPVVGEPLPLADVVFLSFGGAGSVPWIEVLSRPATAARLYASALNPLAHSGFGLDAIVALAGVVRGFLVRTGDLDETARKVATALSSPS